MLAIGTVIDVVVTSCLIERTNIQSQSGVEDIVKNFDTNITKHMKEDMNNDTNNY
jgi:hypothetical protein